MFVGVSGMFLNIIVKNILGLKHDGYSNCVAKTNI